MAYIEKFSFNKQVLYKPSEIIHIDDSSRRTFPFSQGAGCRSQLGISRPPSDSGSESTRNRHHFSNPARNLLIQSTCYLINCRVDNSSEECSRDVIVSTAGLTSSKKGNMEETATVTPPQETCQQTETSIDHNQQQTATMVTAVSNNSASSSSPPLVISCDAAMVGRPMSTPPQRYCHPLRKS